VLVYVSSLAAAGPAPADRPLTEDLPPRPVSDYGRSKLAAEQYLRTLAGDLPATVLRPPSVFGPWDRWTVKLFRLARRGVVLVPGYRVVRLSWVYVGDLVDAILLAGERGRRLAPVQDAARQDQGLYYIALDERPTMVETAQLAAQVEGYRIRRTFHIPPLLCWLSAWNNDLRGRLTGRLFLINPDKIREALAGSWICSADKARRELGFTCRTDLATGFRVTFRWYADHGWL
jgi:nucleoside-diphosphate-sugar epimerase